MTGNTDLTKAPGALSRSFGSRTSSESLTASSPSIPGRLNFAVESRAGLIDGKRWRFTERSLVPVDREDIANGVPGQSNPAWASIDEPRRKDLAAGWPFYKHFTHEGGANTPFIAHWPLGIRKAGDWVRERGHIIDVTPTLRAAAGAAYPANFKGRSVQPAEGLNLLPVFNGESLPGRPLYFEHQAARGLIEGDWKAVWGKRMPWEISWELYNLKNDRSETTNLSERHPDRLKNMDRAWERYAERAGIALE